MPLDYTDGGTPDIVNAELNKYQPVPAAAVTMDTPVDSIGERYRDVVEFDLSSEVAYDSFVAKYPDAWDAYFGPENPAIVTPAYSAENAVSLKEAIKFYLYVNEGETINVVDYVRGGIYSPEEAVRVDAPRISPYAAESGGAYENPDSFYDSEVYSNVTSGETIPIPLLPTDGSRDVSDRVTDKPHLSGMYSSEQLAMKEYEINRASPKTEYDNFGPYAVGRNTY